LPVDKPEEAAVDRDLGNIPRALARLDFGHSEQAGMGQAARIQSPEKYKMRISAPVAIVRRRSRRPKARRIREKRLRSDMLYSRLGSAPL